MNYKIALLTLILAISCVFSQTTGVGYEREDLAVIRDSGADVAHVELTNSYTKAGSEMYLTDCGLTTCYLTLVITPDSPLDARTIIGRVAGGSASYAGAQVYETRMISVPRDLYKTVLANYSQFNNATGKNEIIFYNLTVLDKTIYEDKAVLNWYALDYASMDAGHTYTVRLEYHKADQRDMVDLIPEIAGKRIDGWALWVGTAQIPYWTDGSDGIWINVSLNTTQNLSILINKSMGSDTGNGSRVFPFFDHFDAGSLDTTLWSVYSAGSPVFANSMIMMGGASSIGIIAKMQASNWSVCGYGRMSGAPSHFGFTESAGSSFGAYFRQSSGSDLTRTRTAASITDTSISDYTDVFKRFCIIKNGTTKVEFLMAGVSVSNHTTNIQNLGNLTIEYNPTTNVSFDWVYARSSPLFFTEPYAVSCTDLSATQVLCNISTTTNLTGYQVRIPYTNVNDTNLTVELAEEVLNEAPTLQFIAIDPTTLYKNMTIACAVNWTHPSNSTFTVYQGLTRNGTIVDSFNQTYDNYPNGTIWNYTAYPLSVEFTHGDKLACWSRANSTDANSTYNYTVNYTIGNWAPIISNVQITSPLQNGSNATGSADFTDVEGDVINCRFEWFRNGTSIWNSSQTPCTNTSTLNALNYTVGDLINFTVYANDSYGGNATPVSSATITVSPAFTWNNYTYTASQYESVAYSYTLNFSLPAGDENGTAQLEYNGINLTASCTNVSVTYYCTLSSIQAPLVSTNGTAKNGNWFVSYDSLTAGATTVNKSFTQTVYYGAWATGINSSTIVAGGGPATVNVMYGNTAGITATLSGTAWLLGTSNSGSLTCVAGICSGTITTPSVSSAMLYQVEANITLTSSYWGTTQNRVVRIEATHYFTASNSTNTSSGTVTNPSNGWDLSWTTYATFSSGGAEYFNYTLSQLYNGNFTMKDSGGMRYYAIPSDCLRPVVSLRAQRPGATVLVNYSCYNYSSETYSTIYTTAVLGSALFYEQNMTLWQNNSLVKVVPFGLTTCTVGTPLLYYSCWDETTRGSLTCNYAQTFILNTTSGNLIQSFNGTGASAWTICFYPSTLVGNLSSTEEITATGYDNRFFYILGTAFNSSVTFNETRWAGPTATTKLTFVYVKRAGVGEAGVYVYVQRLFVANSTFRTVGMGKTNDDGTAVVYLEPNDAFYKFVVVDSTGTVLYTSTTQQVGCASTAASCSVTLNIESSVVDFWDYQDGISSACTFSDTTKIYSCSFTVASGVSKYFQLDCYKWAQFGNKTLNCSESTSTASGTLFCDLGDASTTGTYVCYLQSYSTGLILQEDTFNWMAVASWGTTGLFIALILVAVMAWVGTNFGPSMTILLAYVGFAVSWLFQFVNVDLLAMVGLGVVAGAMIYVIKH